MNTLFKGGAAAASATGHSSAEFTQSIENLCAPNMANESCFRNITEELDRIVDDRFGNATNHVPLGEIRKLADFDNVGYNM